VFVEDRNNLPAIQDLFIFAVALYTMDEATMTSPIAIETAICSVPCFLYFRNIHGEWTTESVYDHESHPILAYSSQYAAPLLRAPINKYIPLMFPKRLAPNPDKACKTEDKNRASRAKTSKAEKSKAEGSGRSRAGQSRAEQNRTEQSRAEQSRTEQSRAEQSRADQSRAEECRDFLAIGRIGLLLTWSTKYDRVQTFLRVVLCTRLLCPRFASCEEP
jgi:hypothetical protein